ncbi:pancreatic lipase-related protein 2-like isoform X2 [Contarinia nasturtii]|uniref:pancreatic lipase-related protein 2-like isoform X2 n=1 Tax=Contarinia nasturtii TaxID=265458 RepID=UPI0012D3DD23|nr:pancreatic lipase-related protein 2-like isoform X2 [Contarinia nasturtii]
MQLIYFLLHLRTVSFVVSEEIKCDPFPFGTNFVNVVVAAFLGSILPNFCPCTYPCTAESVKEHVQFFYTKSGLEYYYQLDINNTDDRNMIVQEDDIKFIIHGYTDKVQFNKTGWMEPTGIALANALTNGIVILVDYKSVSSCSYSRSVEEIVPSIGLYLAKVIVELELDTDKIELIGHSIGAHIAGYAGVTLNGTIGRITGLDPAGPGFDETEHGLNKTCARFVQVLHTNPGELGTNKPRGSLNFYANNKTTTQPGCPFKQCGHAKAIFYYFASLFPQYEFIGVDCEQQDSREADTVFSRFGFFTDDIEGSFCFNTTSCFPFIDESSASSTENTNTTASSELDDIVTKVSTVTDEISSSTQFQKSFKATKKYKSGKMIISTQNKLNDQ